MARHGAGTERLAHDLAAVFDEGDFPVFRLDADAVLAGGEQATDAGAARSWALPGGSAAVF